MKGTSPGVWGHANQAEMVMVYFKFQECRNALPRPHIDNHRSRVFSWQTKFQRHIPLWPSFLFTHRIIQKPVAHLMIIEC